MPRSSGVTRAAWRSRRECGHCCKDWNRSSRTFASRAVIPPSAEVIQSVRAELETMPRPEGGVYGADYFRHIRGSLNHIPAIGEGMSRLDLSGLSVGPVFLGIRYLPADGPLNAYVRHCCEDLRDNRGSAWRGPRSFFYEAQETLRATDRDAARARPGSHHVWPVESTRRGRRSHSV